MFPGDGKRPLTIQEIDNMDITFFSEIMDSFNELETKPQEEVYLSDIW